ncbi:MAG: tRNA 2-thiocytidine biosynthesis TtcA family protein [Lachnospiraceae bacterium]|nr:tRNA 2-thiocytidine biosynthesis TtcA family protein [Lachnospiraceae bacterium]
MKLQQLLSYTRRAIDDFQMIKENDRIALGISGGKDSLTLLYAMHGLQRFYPIPFSLEAISVDLGLQKTDYSRITELCASMGVPFHVVKTQIGEIIFNERRESNPCSLCAKMRKGAFNEKAKELGCNKLAYAHHKDDVIETMLMSLIFEGRYHTFSPVTYLDRMDLTLIRPLIYVEECDIVGFKNKYALPVFKNPCPADGYTKREYTKELIQKLNTENPGLRERLFHAVADGSLPAWKKP